MLVSDLMRSLTGRAPPGTCPEAALPRGDAARSLPFARCRGCRWSRNGRSAAAVGERRAEGAVRGAEAGAGRDAGEDARVEGAGGSTVGTVYTTMLL